MFVGPALAFWATKRICLGLQRSDREKVLHGRESGIIVRSETGEFSEIHTPVSDGDRYTLTAHDVHRPLSIAQAADFNGVPAPRLRQAKLRAKVTAWYFGTRIEKPTAEEFDDAHSNGHGPAH